MNKYGFTIAAVVFMSLILSLIVGLKYSQASILFGIIAVGLARTTIHKVTEVNWAVGMLVGLALFASFPLKKLFQLDGFTQKFLLTMIYAGVLWIVGMGWRRNWKQGK